MFSLHKVCCTWAYNTIFTRRSLSESSRMKLQFALHPRLEVLSAISTIHPLVEDLPNVVQYSCSPFRFPHNFSNLYGPVAEFVLLGTKDHTANSSGKLRRADLHQLLPLKPNAVSKPVHPVSMVPLVIKYRCDNCRHTSTHRTHSRARTTVVHSAGDTWEKPFVRCLLHEQNVLTRECQQIVQLFLSAETQQASVTCPAAPPHAKATIRTSSFAADLLLLDNLLQQIEAQFCHAAEDDRPHATPHL
mmetsp:Transcript_15292/g.38899  ORF Transcript_15292/g.38899 Transcript_15292/m.38899 type:complete len:246 (+) Transcript_15292:2014-2751(+)